MWSPSSPAPASTVSRARLASMAALLAAYKVVLLALVLALAHRRPDAFSLGGYLSNFRWPPAKMPGLAEWFTTWDAEQYLYLSEHGYEAGSPSVGLYPLWPLLIRGVSLLLGGHSVVAALVSANLLSLAAWILLYRLVADAHGESRAGWTLLLFLAFPGALFFQFPYSESLFLFLVVVLFTGMHRGRHAWMGLAAFLLPLTRAVGVLCVLPLLWWAWERRRCSLVCAAPLLGYVAYLGFMHASTGNAFEGFAAQTAYVHHPSIANLLDVSRFVRSLLTVKWGHGLMDSPIDRAFFLLFAISLPAIWKINRTWFFYALAVGLVPAMATEFFGYTRFLAVCFPLFVALGSTLRARDPTTPVVLGCAAALLWIVQLGLLLRHVTFRWAG